MSKLTTQIKSFHINSEIETERIVQFIQETFEKTNKKKVVLGWSGGIDSTTTLYLLSKSIRPCNIFVYHLPYLKSYWEELSEVVNNLQIPKQNMRKINIKKSVDEIAHLLILKEKMRIGNIMARVRMIILFDQAKKENALVCGTENRTEHLLGYFTRYGDAASDIEPISHLYKTQVFDLARWLSIPQSIIRRTPSAELWEGQTDEAEYGFSYREADEVLFRFIDKSKQMEQIEQEGYFNVKKIIERYENNKFKQKVPYILR